MSNADPTELSVVVRSDGVTVEKSYEPDDFPVPAIAFVLRSERDESVDVRLVDQVPEEAEPDDIGFHPKYGAEFWSVEDEMIVFERTFEAGEEYTTVYGLRASETEDLESYLTEPELEDVEPPLPEDEQGETVESLDLSDPSDDDSASDDIEAALADVDDGDTGSDTKDGSADATQPTAGDFDVVGELAASIRTGSVEDDDLETLRNALVEGSGDSVDARIEQLQTDVADLRSYTTALEEFLDDEGDAQVVLNELQSAIDDLRGEVATVAGRTEENAQRIGGVDDEVADLAESVDEFESEIDEIGHVTDRIDELEEGLDRIEELESSLETVEDQIEQAQDDIESLREMRDQLTSVFGEQMQNAGGDA
jgi:uncharacterized phage infection (PIP) family protein YhgE